MILIFPPYFREVEKPSPNIPCLAGHLKSNGIKVTAIDANIRFFNYYLKEPGLFYLKEAADKAFNELDEHTAPLNAFEAYRYEKIAGIACTSFEELAQMAVTAADGMHKESFYEPGQYMAFSSLIQNIAGAAVVLTESVTDTLVPHSSRTAVEAVLSEAEHTLYGKFYLDQLVELIGKEKDSFVYLMLDFNSQLIPALVLAKLLKRNCPGITIVAGGDICPNLNDACRRMPEILHLFDGIITYSYETVLLDLCHGVPRQELKFYLYMENGKICEQRVHDHTDQCVRGIPDYSGDSLKSYFSPEPELTVYTGNGCYWAKCAFCNIHVRTMKHCEKKIEEVLKEITILQASYGTKLISFGDEEIRLDRLLEIADGLLEHNISVKWTAQSRFDMELKQEEYDRIRQSGCVYLGFGLESGDDSMLRKMRTGFTSDVAEKVLAEVHKSGILTNVSIVVGFPGESPNQWNATIEFLKMNSMHISSLLPLCYSLTKHSAVEKERCFFSIGRVFDEENKDALLYFYPNFAETYPDWKTREERIMQLYSEPELREMLSREKFPRGLYACKSERTSFTDLKSDYELVLLHRDIKKIQKEQKYYFSGDYGIDRDCRFDWGECWYLYNILLNHWIALTRQEAVILRNHLSGGSTEELAGQLHVSQQNSVLLRALCLRKFQLFINREIKVSK